MKVLVTCVAGAGHVRPLLPLAHALLAQGDQVVFAMGEDPDGAVDAIGAEFARAGSGEMEWFDTFRSRVRGFPGDGLAPERIPYYFVPRLFADIATVDMIDDVLEVGKRLQPDIVLFETYAFAGPLAAELLGVPSVHHLIGLMIPTEVLELANDALSPLWRSFGRDIPGFGGVFRGTTIEIAPPSLDPVRVPAGDRLGLRPAPLPIEDRHPAPPGARPLVYLTMGTFFGGNLEVFRAVLDGLADENLDVVVTLGAAGDPAALGPVPGNVTVERFVPQAELLPRCSAVVHHGGAGTMFGSLAHGLPQVVIPQGADNFTNGHALADAGVGTVVAPGELSPERARHDVRRVLDDPAFSEAAANMAADIAAMPGSDAVARSLLDRLGGG